MATVSVHYRDLSNAQWEILNMNFANPNSDIAFPGLGLITSTTTNPSGPYGLYGGPSGRALMVHGKVVF